MNASLQAVANVARVLKAGRGRVLVRDYAEGDLAQLRLSGPTRNQRLSHNFYVRSDGTQAYYFSKVSFPAAHCLLCCLQQALTVVQSVRLRLFACSLVQQGCLLGIGSELDTYSALC